MLAARYLQHSDAEAGSSRLGFRTTNPRIEGERAIIVGLLLFIIFGFVIGLIARAVMPGDQKMGILMTIGLGVAGSFIGGFLVSLVTSHRVTDFHTASVIGSVVGALIILLVAGGLSRRRAHA